MRLTFSRLIDISGAVFFFLLACFSAITALTAQSIGPAMIYIGSLFAVVAFVTSMLIEDLIRKGRPHDDAWWVCFAFAVVSAAFIGAGVGHWVLA